MDEYEKAYAEWVDANAAWLQAKVVDGKMITLPVRDEVRLEMRIVQANYNLQHARAALR